MYHTQITIDVLRLQDETRMQIQQINCQYLPGEDRLLLRISMTENMEHQFLITRRFLKLLLEAILGHFKACNVEAAPVATSETQEAMMQFEHQKAIEKTNIEKTHEDKEIIHDAKLLFTLKARTDKKSKIILGLYGKDQQGIELAMANEMAHSFIHILEKTAKLAQWDMHLYFNEEALKKPPGDQMLQ
jgi:hypothetical protein